MRRGGSRRGGVCKGGVWRGGGRVLHAIERESAPPPCAICASLHCLYIAPKRRFGHGHTAMAHVGKEAQVWRGGRRGRRGRRGVPAAPACAGAVRLCFCFLFCMACTIDKFVGTFFKILRPHVRTTASHVSSGSTPLLRVMTHYSLSLDSRVEGTGSGDWRMESSMESGVWRV